MKTIGELIELQAAKYGEKPYLIVPEREEIISYQQLNQRVSQTANLLRQLQITHGDKVALLLPNIPEFLYFYFGTMKLGAIAGPVNILLKSAELQYVIHNSEAKVLATTSTYLPALQAIRDQLPLLQTILVVDEPDSELAQSFYPLLEAQSTEIEQQAVASHDEAMIIYTSGTTGHPKGVLLTHENLLYDAEQIAIWHGLTPDDRAMCILPLFHVNGEVVTLITPLLSGGSVVMPERFSASQFFPTIAKYRVNWFSAVPTNLTILLNTNVDLTQYDLSSLRFCICGAAPLPVEVQRAFEQKVGIYIIEGYGLSETTCYSSFNPHPPHGEEGIGTGNQYRRYGSIGLPVGNEMKVVDQNGNELPAYERGEIIVRGQNVMKGYFKRPEANEEAFRDGWFHTGDVGYRDEDGYFYLTDRKKDMIIRGGENIYPREVDEALYAHPKVRDAATVGIPDEKYGEEVLSFIVLKEGCIATEKEFLDYCSQQLADYKCPKEIRFIAEIPKGPSGKLLRRKLIEQELQQ
ncbi:class I adenylate-forming enzyme family protein [Rubeoparvulum massiliense]|uniref:class I adenylate-forming enzyme family protein n=1 Tax=Rubeoparvulum massiliense TaxID=1631346 RepID=UPI00065E6E8F|nr:long-chain-fatty-acid--CoA ligase [Rubeoparvulum massiliense]